MISITSVPKPPRTGVSRDARTDASLTRVIRSRRKGLRRGQFRRQRRVPPTPWSLSQPDEPFQLPGIGPAHATASVTRQPPVPDPAALEPGVKHALPDPHFGRQIDHEPFVPTQPGTPRVTGGAIAWRVFPNQSADDVLMEPHRPVRRAKVLRVQLPGDRDERPAHGTEFPDAGHHAGENGGLLVPAHKTGPHNTGPSAPPPRDGHAGPHP